MVARQIFIYTQTYIIFMIYIRKFEHSFTVPVERGRRRRLEILELGGLVDGKWSHFFPYTERAGHLDWHFRWNFHTRNVVGAFRFWNLQWKSRTSRSREVSIYTTYVVVRSTSRRPVICDSSPSFCPIEIFSFVNRNSSTLFHLYVNTFW